MPLVGARAGGGANWGVLGPGMPRIDANFADAERLEEPFGELMIEDLIGLRGPISHLLENAAMVTVFNVMVIAAVVCVPFNIGRMTVYAAETVQLSLEPQDLEWLQVSRERLSGGGRGRGLHTPWEQQFVVRNRSVLWPPAKPMSTLADSPSPCARRELPR